MAFRPTFSKGRNNVFFQATSVADQPEAPVKGNLNGVGDQRPIRHPRFGKGFVRPNQQVSRPNEPPKAANWQSLSRPYQAAWGLRNGLTKSMNRRYKFNPR